MAADTHLHLIGRHHHPDWHGHCDPSKRGYKLCDRWHWHVWWRHEDHDGQRGIFPDLAAVLSQLLDLIAAVWRERRCSHRWDEQRTEPACCVTCGTSRKDRR